MNSAVIYNADGVIEMIVHPDNEAQLDDPAFNPKGCVQVRIPREVYDTCSNDIDLHQKVIAISKDAKLVPLLTQKVADYEAKVAADAQARADAIAAFDAEVAKFEQATGLVYDSNDTGAFDSWQIATIDVVADIP